MVWIEQQIKSAIFAKISKNVIYVTFCKALQKWCICNKVTTEDHVLNIFTPKQFQNAISCCILKFCAAKKFLKTFKLCCVNILQNEKQQ